jgi:hypothetical protein
MWSTLASVRDGVQKTAFEGLAKVSTVLAEDVEFDEETSDGADAEVYRTLLENLQFEQLKLSNEYSAAKKEQQELRLKYDDLVAKQGGGGRAQIDSLDNLAQPSPGLQEKNEMLANQVEAWEVRDAVFFFQRLLSVIGCYRASCGSLFMRKLTSQRS